jgi:hypothetical protein
MSTQIEAIEDRPGCVRIKVDDYSWTLFKNRYDALRNAGFEDFYNLNEDITQWQFGRLLPKPQPTPATTTDNHQRETAAALVDIQSQITRTVSVTSDRIQMLEDSIERLYSQLEAQAQHIYRLCRQIDVLAEQIRSKDGAAAVRSGV